VEVFLQPDGELMSGKKGIKAPYDWEEYAKVHFPKAEELEGKAIAAEKAGDKAQACEYYLYGQESQLLAKQANGMIAEAL
jgi:hypothetical protein